MQDIPPHPEGLKKTEENLFPYMASSFEEARRMQRPRLLKSHLPLALLPEDLVKKCKVIYVARYEIEH